MGIWYGQIGSYFEKIEKKIKEIEQQMYYSNLPGPLSMKYLSISSEDEGCYIYEGREKLKDILYKLQFFAHLNSHPTDRKGECKIRLNILGQRITFYLTESFVPSAYKTTGKKSVRGRQILFHVNDDGKKKMTEYSDIMPDLEAYSSTELGYAMMEALNTSQFNQTSAGLSESIIRPATLFILLTHIPEAAIPFNETSKEFKRAVFYNTQLSENAKDKITKIKKKTGRVPMADKIVRGKLRDVASGKVTFTEAFSEENYPLRRKGGTHDGRTWVLKDQNGKLTGNLSESESDDEEMNPCVFSKHKTPIFTRESLITRRKGGIHDGRTWVFKDPNDELTGNLSDSDCDDEGMTPFVFPKYKTPIFTWESLITRRKGGIHDGRTWVFKDPNDELTGNLSDSDCDDERMTPFVFPKYKTQTFTRESLITRRKGGTHDGRTWVLKDQNDELTGNIIDSDIDEECVFLIHKTPTFSLESCLFSSYEFD